jgi:phenylacetate-CoA ligase
MHVNAYGLLAEIDYSGSFADSGIGRILVTDLWNLGMPLIRYEIGDVGGMTSEPCECGSELPRITSLDGRADDVFVNSLGQRIPGVAIVNRITLDNSKIREMQFVQKAIGRFDVSVVPGENWQGEASAKEVVSKLSDFMQEPTEALVSVVKSIPREPSGKVRFCKSLLES